MRGRPFFVTKGAMRLTLLFLALLLTACSAERSPAPTAEEDAQLNEAENLLDKVAAPPAER